MATVIVGRQFAFQVDRRKLYADKAS